MALSPQRAFGVRIRELRLAVGMTQEDLAHRCGMFRTYMSRVETGQANPTLTMIHALAVSLKVPVTALFALPAKAPTKAASPTAARKAAPAKPVPRARPSRGRVSR